MSIAILSRLSNPTWGSDFQVDEMFFQIVWNHKWFNNYHFWKIGHQSLLVEFFVKNDMEKREPPTEMTFFFFITLSIHLPLKSAYFENQYTPAQVPTPPLEGPCGSLGYDLF